MKESEIRKQMALATVTVERLPAIPEEKLHSSSCQKIPLGNIAALGVAFQPLTSAVQNIVTGGSGTSGLYWVNTHGLQMATFNNKAGYLGSLLTESGQVGGGQAVLTPFVDPTYVFMSAALLNLEKKLDDIKEMQTEILDFLKQKEKADLRGNLKTLFDILENYKFNWNNEKYKTNKHILVQDIRRDAEKSIIFYSERIENRLKKKNVLPSDQEVKSLLQKLEEDFQEYQLSLYVYAFSSFLEVMLLENFDSEYLSGVSQKIERYTLRYRELYTASYNKAEGLSTSSVQARLFKGLAGIAKGAGGAIAKIPVVSKSQIDETLIGAGNHLGSVHSKRTQKSMKHFSGNSVSYTRTFVDNIEMLDRIYNEPMEILFDKDNIYLLKSETPNPNKDSENKRIS